MLNPLIIKKMLNAEEVTPKKWTEIKVLFDDDEYSVICGKYQNDFCHGVRWNGYEESKGYPGQGSYPTWYVEPPFLTLPILNHLFIEVIKNPGVGDIENIRYAINRFVSQYKEKYYLTEHDVNFAIDLNLAINEYLKNCKKIQIKPKDLMPYLIQKKIFYKNYNDGQPLRNFLRKLDEAEKLDLIDSLKVERKENNRFWYFEKKR
jgi:hypothetical protein